MANVNKIGVNPTGDVVTLHSHIFQPRSVLVVQVTDTDIPEYEAAGIWFFPYDVDYLTLQEVCFIAMREIRYYRSLT